MDVQSAGAAMMERRSASGFDLVGYLHQHQGDFFVMLAISTCITMGHWRHWFYADDLCLPNGERDPRAGKFNMNKATGDFFFIPSLVVLGMLFLGYRDNLVYAAAFVAVCAFVGAAFIMTTIEKARDGALGIALQALTNWLPGGKK